MELKNRMISAECLKTKCYEICDEYNTEHLYIDRIIDEIDNAPDVEVVRCKDCVHWYEPEEVCLKIYSDGAVSPYAWQYRKPDDFCSYGEREVNGRKKQ